MKRIYDVVVSQAFEKMHRVEATSAKEARQIVQSLIRDECPDGILESLAGDVGPEKIVQVSREES